MLIKSDYEKVFAYFITSNLDFKGEKFVKTGKQLAFYWINGIEELVTCVSTLQDQKIITDENNFIHVEWRLFIRNKREGKDFASLYCDYWEGMKSGEDEYPRKGRFK